MTAINSIQSLAISAASSTTAIKHSHLQRYFKPESASPFSVKVVLQGEERYLLNQRHYRLQKGQYLVVNADSQLQIEVESKAVVEGICLYPPKEMLLDVHASLSGNLDQMLRYPERRDASVDLLEHSFSLSSNRTGRYLGSVLPALTQSTQEGESLATEEFLMQMCEYLLLDQQDDHTGLKALPSTKTATREELFRRISAAKDFLYDNYREKVELEDLAALSCLSKYHFLRSFKSLYGLSPIQYLLGIRLEKARDLLEKRYSLSEVSGMVGFSDPSNLRKVLKRSDASRAGQS